MSVPRRTVVYLDAELYRALRRRSAESDLSISEMVNDAVRLAFSEDVGDLEALKSRAREGALDFKSVVRGLKRRQRL